LSSLCFCLGLCPVGLSFFYVLLSVPCRVVITLCLSWSVSCRVVISLCFFLSVPCMVVITLCLSSRQTQSDDNPTGHRQQDIKKWQPYRTQTKTDTVMTTLQGTYNNRHKSHVRLSFFYVCCCLCPVGLSSLCVCLGLWPVGMSSLYVCCCLCLQGCHFFMSVVCACMVPSFCVSSSVPCRVVISICLSSVTAWCHHFVSVIVCVPILLETLFFWENPI
jgi:hypothetical protein